MLAIFWKYVIQVLVKEKHHHHHHYWYSIGQPAQIVGQVLFKYHLPWDKFYFKIFVEPCWDTYGIVEKY